MTVLTASRLPADLRLWRAVLRVTRRGHGLARRLWLGRLNSLGALAAPTKFGFVILVDPTDYHGWSLAMQGEHEPGVTAWILRQLLPGDTFVDVGANHGWFALLAARHLQASRGKVYAYEPQAHLCALLRRSAEINGFDHMIIVQAAVGEKAHWAVLRVSARGESRYGSLAPAAGAGEGVKVIRLDEDLAGQPPAVVKIDVEGYELRVLRGMGRMLADKRLRSLAIEVHPPEMACLGDDVADLLTILRDAGYQLAWASGVARDRVRLRDVSDACRTISCFNLFATRA